LKQCLTYNDEVRRALVNRTPIVALESILISRGMPYPHNLENAKAVEQIVRDHGAVPATIAVMNRRIHIGLEEHELEELATNKSVEKASRRNLPYLLASGKIGATTAAAAMIATRLAGVRVFATGGIGGVHRDGTSSWDISDDLNELVQTDVAVVCAGVKATLDISKTLQYLRRYGVPVVGYRCDEFPSFFSRVSPFGVDFRLDSPEEIGDIMDTKWKLGLQGSLVIANPVPEAHSLDYEEINSYIVKALEETRKSDFTGKVTAYLFDRVREMTGGRSLETNVALFKHNAEVAASIAVAYQTCCK